MNIDLLDPALPPPPHKKISYCSVKSENYFYNYSYTVHRFGRKISIKGTVSLERGIS